MTAKQYVKGIGLFLVIAIAALAGSTAASRYVTGDANSSGAVDVDDVVFLVAYIFSGGAAPQPIEAGDADCSSNVDIDDVVYLIAYIFSGGPAPCGGSDPSGTLTNADGCKIFPDLHPDSDSTWFRDCIEYQYDGVSTLILKHVNAGFNCCPEITTEISFAGDTITIEEIELSGDCDCLCLFDLDYEIIDLLPGEYTISVIEPYVLPTNDPLILAVDLSVASSGIFCVYRYHYPWGFPQEY
jgi:hypothetical protein